MKSGVSPSTTITKTQFLLADSGAVNTNLGVLGLHLHFSSLEPVNFFGAQSSLGGEQFSFGVAQAVIWGARPRNAPRGAGPDFSYCRMRFEDLQMRRGFAERLDQKR